MATYIILSKLTPGAFQAPEGLKGICNAVKEKLRVECPKATWVQSYGCMGGYDVVDIVETDDPQQIEKAVLIIRALGRSTTETLLATPWDEFVKAL